jgi:hypothetical protein
MVFFRLESCCPIRFSEQASISRRSLIGSLSRHEQTQPGRLSGIEVARVVKKLAERAGLDAVKYAGHSLRQDTLQAERLLGLGEVDYESDGAQERADGARYIRDGSLFRKNSSRKLGL